MRNCILRYMTARPHNLVTLRSQHVSSIEGHQDDDARKSIDTLKYFRQPHESTKETPRPGPSIRWVDRGPWYARILPLNLCRPP